MGTLANYVWVPCPMCWGQALIHEPAGNGEGLIPVPCSYCNGTGSTLRTQQGDHA